MTKVILLPAATALACQATSVLYDNTTSDTGFSIFYSEGYTAIGDEVLLVSAGELNRLDAQFFNEGSDATFDATVMFYNAASPVGSQIGGSYTVSDISIVGNTSQTVTFADIGLSVPEDLIVVISIANQSTGGDIGVNFFDPPTVGTSDNNFFIADDGTGLAQVSTNMGIDNIYLQVTDIPEPSTMSLALGSIALLGILRRRRAQG